MNGFMVPARFALPAVPAEALSPLELVHWTMNPDEVDVEVRKPATSSDIQRAVSTMCSTMRLLPAPASAGRHR